MLEKINLYKAMLQWLGVVSVILLFVFCSSATATELAIDPDSLFEENINDTISFDITVSEVDSLFAFGCDLVFDADLIEIVEVVEGPFLCCSTVDTVDTEADYEVYGDTLMLAVAQLATSSPGATTVESSVLLTVRARVIAFGECDLEFHNTSLIKPDGFTTISHDVINGFLSVEYPCNNVSVSIDPADSTVYTTQRFRLQLNVDDVSRLFAFSTDLSYSSDYLRVDSIVEGPFLNVFESNDDTKVWSDIDSLTGQILIGGSILAYADTGVSTTEPVPLVYVYLRATDYGSANVSIDEMHLLSPNGVTEYPISSLGDCELNVVPSNHLTIQPFSSEGIDTYADESLPDQNFGSDSILRVSSGVSSRVALLDFSLGSSLNGVEIGSAELSMYGGDEVNLDTISIQKVTEAWDEETVTWNTLPDTASSKSSFYADSTSWWNWDISEIVQDWVIRSDNYGVLLHTSSNNGNNNGFFSSDYLTDSMMAPKLDIYYFYPPSCADLVVAGGSIQVEEEQIIEGEVASLSAIVYNMGSSYAYNVDVQIYNGIPGISNYELISEMTLPIIRPYGSETVHALWDTDGRAGDQVVFVWVDPENVVSECDTINNRVAKTIHVYEKPDLYTSCDNMHIGSTHPVEGEALPISFVVTNMGEATIGSYSATLYVGDPSSGGILIDDVLVDEDLNGFAIDTVEYTFQTNGYAGGNDLYFILDPNNDIIEEDEDNNEIECQVTVYNPSLTLATNCDTEASPNDTVSFSVTIENHASVKAHDATLDIQLPDELSILSSSLDPDSGTVSIWTVDSLDGGGSFELDIDLLMQTSAVPGNIIDVQSSLSYENGYGLIQQELYSSNSIDVGEDITPPQLLASVSPPRIDEGTVTIACAPSESLLVDPTVVLVASNDDTLLFTGPTYLDGIYTIQTEIVDTIPDGNVQVGISVQDLAGNTGSASTYFSVDHLAPSLQVEIDDTLSLGLHTLVVTTSEPLQSVPSVSVIDSAGNAVSAIHTEQNGIEYYYDVNIADTTSTGWANIQITGTDLVLNDTTIIDSVYIFNESPQLTISIPSILPEGTTAFVVYSSRDLSGFPSASGSDAEAFGLNISGPLPMGEGYKFWCNVKWSTAEGPATINISASDLYGNTADTTIAISIDKSGPEFSVLPSDSAISGPREFTVLSSEGCPEAPVVHRYFADGADHGELSIAGSDGDTSFTYLHTEGDTIAWLQISGTDSAGNESEAEQSYLNVATYNYGIVFSDVPGQGSDVLVTTYIHNTGLSRIDSMSVSVWTEIPIWGTRIDTGLVVSIPAQDSVLIETLWPASEQSDDYVIFITCDQDMRYSETNENDNTSYKGAIGLYTLSSKGSYVKDYDTSATFYCRVIDKSTWEEVTDTSQLTVVFEVRDSLGSLIIQDDTLQYDEAKGYFTKVLNPSSVFDHGPYWALFHAEVSGGSGVVTDSIQFRMLSSLLLSCDTDKELYYRGESVQFFGDVLYHDSSAAGFTDVEVYVKSKGGTRRIKGETDAYGHYDLSFNPSATEAGQYQAFVRLVVGAFVFADTTEFDIDGCLVNPSGYNLRLSQNSSWPVTIAFKNIGVNTALIDSIFFSGPESSESGIDIAINTSPTDMSVEPGTQTSFIVEVDALPTAVSESEYDISVAFNDSLTEDATLMVHTDPARPIIELSSFRLEYILNPGVTLTKQITLENTGYTCWRGIETPVSTSSKCLASLSCPGDSLPTGSTATLDITINISDTASYGVYDDTITVPSANYQDILIYVRSYVTPGTSGDIQFYVKSDQGDPLTGAKVYLYSQVWDPDTDSYPVYHDTTYGGGICNFLNLPAGPYNYKVKAEGFLSEIGHVTIGSGQTLDSTEVVSLEPQPIEMTWVVQETTIEDVYHITLEITYDPDTSLAPPLLLVRPTVISHGYEISDSTQYQFGTFELMNAGETTAEDINIEWPSLSGKFSVHLYTPDGQLPDAIADGLQPGETVEVPYWIELFSGLELCGEYDRIFRVTGTYQKGSSTGEVEAYAQFVVGNLDCDYDIEFNPNPIVIVSIPCLLDNSCECDPTSFLTETISLDAINRGDALAKMSPAVLFKHEFGFGLSNIVPVGSAAELILQTLETAGSVGGAQWQPSNIYPGDTATANITYLDLPTTLVGVTFGAVITAAEWPNAVITYGIPVVGMTIGDFGLGNLLYCLPLDINLDFNTGSGMSGFGTGGYGGYGWSVGSGWGSLPSPPTPETEEPGLIKIVIEQTLTTERQGFNAYLQVINGFETYSIDDFDVDIEVKDENGVVLAADQHVASNPLFFSMPDLLGISDIDGEGSIAAQSTARADWLIIPKTESGGTTEAGKKYYLTANVSYSIGGENYTYSTQSEEITVLPQPLLNLTYFIPKYFYDYDPFALALKIENVGAGTARNLKMDSDQPVAVQCADLVDVWEITGSYLEGEEMSPSLLIEFGDLAPGNDKMGYWIIEAAPGGEVVDFTASYIHDDSLGGESTSLINEINTYIIMSDDLGLDPDMPFATKYGDPEDEFLGMLIDQNRDDNPDAIYNMKNGDEFNVSNVIPSQIIQPTYANPVMKVYASGADEWIYFRVSDPFLGTKAINSVHRQDGTLVPDNNYWIDSNFICICDNPYDNEFYSIQFGNVVNKPDLKIGTSDIAIMACTDCGTIDAGDSTVSINIRVHNSGNRDVDSALVEVYDGTSQSGTMIASFYTDGIPKGSYYDHTTVWETGPPADWVYYYHDIHVAVDPLSEINELSVANNVANKGIDFDVSHGDCDHNDKINVTDAYYLVKNLFEGGADPIPELSGEMNCDGDINVADVVWLMNYIFGGPEPCDSRLPGQKQFISSMRPDANVLIEGNSSDDALSLVVSGEFETDIAGFQLEIDFSKCNLEVISIESSDESSELPLYHSVEEGILKIGMVDLMGRKSISSPGGELLRIRLELDENSKNGLNEMNIEEVVLSSKSGYVLNATVRKEIDVPIIPRTFSLSQNYPNPFNPNTVIEFSLPKTCHVELTVINILGQTVTKLIDGQMDAGYKRIQWNGTNSDGDRVASGVYFYRIKASDFVQTKKMVILK